MRLTWLGHSGFRMEIGEAVLLIDPWLVGNPSFDEGRRAEAIAGATHVLLTHGHFDHAADAVAISRELGIPVVGVFDLVQHWAETEGIETLPFHKGGTVRLADVDGDDGQRLRTHPRWRGATGPIYAGSPAGLHDRPWGAHDLRVGRHRHHGRHGLDGRVARAQDRDPVLRRALHHGHRPRGLGRPGAGSTSRRWCPATTPPSRCSRSRPSPCERRCPAWTCASPR